MKKEEIAGKGISAGQTSRSERAWCAWESRNSSVQFSVKRGETEGGAPKERYDERKEERKAGIRSCRTRDAVKNDLRGKE